MGTKISQLPSASSLTGSELIETVQGGTSKKTTTQAIADLGSGSVSIPATAYASNADAVAALGVGVLYKSATSINGSPHILITV